MSIQLHGVSNSKLTFKALSLTYLSSDITTSTAICAEEATRNGAADSTCFATRAEIGMAQYDLRHRLSVRRHGLGYELLAVTPVFHRCRETTTIGQPGSSTFAGKCSLGLPNMDIWIFECPLHSVHNVDFITTLVCVCMTSPTFIYNINKPS